MEVWIAVFLLLCTLVVSREGFNPFEPESRPTGYPDQSMYGDIILAQKHIHRLLKSPTLGNKTRVYLLDLLNLLQFI